METAFPFAALRGVQRHTLAAQVTEPLGILVVAEMSPHV